MKQNWVKRTPATPYNEDDDILVKLFKIYGIKDYEGFIKPKPHALYSPHLLSNITKAFVAISEAIKHGKKIAIYADIDCDGITSAAMLYNYLKQLTDNVCYFHAQRSDGHGISVSVNDVPESTELLIIVDSSTSDTEACQTLTERGIEIVILDHHHPDKKKPENVFATIVNNQLCNYPNKELSGAGVTWKMIEVLDERFQTGTHMDFIDLAAIGVYGDAMSMREQENRYIVYHGLKNVVNLGVRELLAVKNISLQHYSSGDIGFAIAPMLNGASRMDRIELVLELLTTDDPVRCKELAKEVNALNELRKQMQAMYVEALTPQIDESDSVIIVTHPDIGKGFTGLVAGELATKYKRPALVLAEVGDYHGSARSYGGFNVREYLLENPLTKFAAGHDQACGVGVCAKDFEMFKALVNLGYERSESFDVKYDLEIEVKDLSMELLEKIEEFSMVTGKSMHVPRFLVKGIRAFGGINPLSNGTAFTIDCGKPVIEDKRTYPDGVNLYLAKFRTDPSEFDDLGITTFTQLEAVGSLSINRWSYRKGGKFITTIKKQVFIDEIDVVK